MLWNSTPAWSSSAVWGETLVAQSAAAWAPNASGPTGALSDCSVIWGEMAGILGEN
jgi:hypothetical protein